MKRESKWIISEPKTFLEFMLKHRSIRITMEENVAENAKVLDLMGTIIILKYCILRRYQILNFMILDMPEILNRYYAVKLNIN